VDAGGGEDHGRGSGAEMSLHACSLLRLGRRAFPRAGPPHDSHGPPAKALRDAR